MENSYGFSLAWIISIGIAIFLSAPTWLRDMRALHQEGVFRTLGSLFCNNWKGIVRILAITIFIISSGIGLYGNLKLENENMDLKSIVAWSRSGATVDTKVLNRFKNSHKAVLIFRLDIKSVDYLSDQNIVKSNFFEIDGNVHEENISIPESFWSQVGSSTGLVHTYLAVLPKNISATDISRLADIKTNGGRIIAKRGVRAIIFMKRPKQLERSNADTNKVQEAH